MDDDGSGLLGLGEAVGGSVGGGSRPSLLACAGCGEAYGLPPGLRVEAAARCPYCLVVSAQPPTFAQKHAVLQSSLRSGRLRLQGLRRARAGPKIRVVVGRSAVLADSFAQLRQIGAATLCAAPLAVSFEGEDGVDQGGVTREWMSLLMLSLLDPQVALFSPGAEMGRYMYTVNPLSHFNPEHLEYFSLVGVLMAKCITDGLTTRHAYFTPEVWAAILGRPPRCVVQTSKSGHQLLLPPANWCPIFAPRTTQADRPGCDRPTHAALARVVAGP